MSQSDEKEFESFLLANGYTVEKAIAESAADFFGMTAEERANAGVYSRLSVYDILRDAYDQDNKQWERIRAENERQEMLREERRQSCDTWETPAAPTLPRQQPNDQSRQTQEDNEPPTIYDFLAPQSDPRPAKLKPEIVKGFLRENYRLELVGTLKGGKSTLFEQLGTMAARGLPTLGFEFTRPLNMLYIDPEMWAEEYKARGDKMRDKLLADQPDDIKFDRVGGNPNIHRFYYLPMKKNRPTLERLIKNVIASVKASGIHFDVIIFDSIYKFFPGNENDPESWTLTFQLFDLAQDELDCSIWYSHHTTKGNQFEKETVDLGSGSNYQGRDYDAFIAILPLTITKKQKAAYGWDKTVAAYELSFVSRYFPTWDAFRVLSKDGILERTEETDRQLAGCLHSKAEYNQEESAERQKAESDRQQQARLDVITGTFEKAGINMLTKSAIIDAMKKSVAFEGCKSDASLENEYDRILKAYDGKLFIRHSNKRPVMVEYLGGGNNA